MKSQHTPGPWYAGVTAVWVGGSILAHCHGNKADVNLMAAAPKLLEMCETIDSLLASRFWMDDTGHSGRTIKWGEVRRDLQQVITKANGG